MPSKKKKKQERRAGFMRLPKGSDKILHFTVLALVLFGSVMIVDINVGQDFFQQHGRRHHGDQAGAVRDRGICRDALRGKAV